MLFSNVIAAAATIAAIVAPTIPGCGPIASGILKIGMIMTASAAATVVEKASTSQPIKTPLMAVATDTIIIGICTYASVIGLIPGTLAALLAIIFTVTIEASLYSSDEVYTKYKEVME